MASDRPEIVSMMRHAQSPTLPAWIGKALLNACAPGAIASALRAPRTRPVAASNHRVERPVGSHSACCRLLELIGPPPLRGSSGQRRVGTDGVRSCEAPG